MRTATKTKQTSKKNPKYFWYVIVFQVSCGSCRPGTGSDWEVPWAVLSWVLSCPSNRAGAQSVPPTPACHLPQLPRATCSIGSEDVIDSSITWQFWAEVRMQTQLLHQRSHSRGSALWSPYNDPASGSGSFWAAELLVITISKFYKSLLFLPPFVFFAVSEWYSLGLTRVIGILTSVALPTSCRKAPPPRVPLGDAAP